MDRFGETLMHTLLQQYLVSMSFDYFDTPSHLEGTPLSQMAKIGASNVWFTLLEYGARISGTGKISRYDMLRHATYGGSTSIVTSVLDSGVSISLSTIGSQGFLLHIAAENGDAAMVGLLLDKGANIEQKGFQGRSALHPACHERQIDVVRLLLERGAEVNSKDIDGNTPLHAFVDAWQYNYRCLAIVKLLIACGARVNARNLWGSTPLFRIFMKSSWVGQSLTPYWRKVCSCLLMSGADPHLLGWSHFNQIEKTGYLCTPVDVAKLSYGCDSLDAFVGALAKHYPEITVDTDRDVFWNAKEEIIGEGYGCSYESEIRWQEEDDKRMKIYTEYSREWRRQRPVLPALL